MPYIGKPQSADPITVNASNIEDGSILAADISSSLGDAISGSFTTVSSSFSTRVSDVEAGSTSKTLVSSSAQIADDISGSLGSNAAVIRSLDRTTISGSVTTVSSSLASRVTVNEGRVNQGVKTTDSPTFAGATITGTLTAQEVHTEFESASILFTSGSTQFGNSSDDVHDFLGNTISGSATSTGSFGMVGIGGLPGEANSKFAVDGNIEMLSGSNRLFIPRASDGALTTSIFSRTGNNLTLSGAGSSGGQVEFIPSSANSSAVTLTIESSGRMVASSVLSAGQDYLDGDASLYLANAGSDGTMIKFGDTNAGLVYGGSGTGTFKVMQRQNTVFSIDASRNVLFNGVVQLADVAQSIDFIQSGAINFDSNGDQTGRVLTIGSNRTGDSGGTTNVTFEESGNTIFSGDGKVGIGQGSPTNSPLEVNLTQSNGTTGTSGFAHFGSNGNTDGHIQGISLGYRESNANYRKIAIAVRGRGDGATRSDLCFLVDTANDAASATLQDAKLTIDGLTGDATFTNAVTVNSNLLGGGQRFATSGKSVNVGSSTTFDISGTSSGFVFVKIIIKVGWNGNATYQMHSQYNYVTCNYATTGGESRSDIVQVEAGNAQFNYSDFSISRPSDRTVRLTYAPSGGSGSHTCNIYVSGVFDALS